jgi:hypothetical protein
MGLCYDFGMRRLAVLTFLVAIAAGPAQAQDPLADARRLYNTGDYEAAERMARLASDVAVSANAARVVIGRIELERYRRSGAQGDLAAARSALRGVDPSALDDRDRLEWTIGLAEALYLEDRFGAAAELFEPVIDAAAALGPAAHERVLDWWATAMDRQAQLRPSAERSVLYERVADRMAVELARDPGSSPAGYWLAAAARGRGDIDRAWQAAIAGWMRAPLARDRGAALRADLDRLVVQAIIPERLARLALRDHTQALAGMLGEWEAFKVSWSK